MPLSSHLVSHRTTNRLHAIFLIASLMGIVALCGALLAGWLGLVFAGVSLVLIMAATTRRGSGALLRLYKAQPLTVQNAPELVQLFNALVQRAELHQVPRLYYIPTKELNAFAVGHGEEASVALTAGIISRLNPRELAGVIAHELSHISHNDVFVMSLADGLSRITTALGQAGQLMILFSLPAFLMGYDVPWLAGIVLLLAPGASALLQLALSRSREYNADVGAVRITGDPMGLASALARLETRQGSWLDRVLMPGRRETQPALLRTHPHTSDRIARLNELAGDVPASTLPRPATYTTQVRHPALKAPRWHVLGLWY